MAENRPNRSPYQLERHDNDPASYVQLMYEQHTERDAVERVRDPKGQPPQTPSNAAPRATKTTPPGKRGH